MLRRIQSVPMPRLLSSSSHKLPKLSCPNLAGHGYCSSQTAKVNSYVGSAASNAVHESVGGFEFAGLRRAATGWANTSAHKIPRLTTSIALLTIRCAPPAKSGLRKECNGFPSREQMAQACRERPRGEWALPSSLSTHRRRAQLLPHPNRRSSYLFDNHQPSRLLHQRKDGLFVQRNQRPRIE